MVDEWGQQSHQMRGTASSIETSVCQEERRILSMPHPVKAVLRRKDKQRSQPGRNANQVVIGTIVVVLRVVWSFAAGGQQFPAASRRKSYFAVDLQRASPMSSAVYCSPKNLLTSLKAMRTCKPFAIAGTLGTEFLGSVRPFSQISFLVPIHGFIP